MHQYQSLGPMGCKQDIYWNLWEFVGVCGNLWGLSPVGIGFCGHSFNNIYICVYMSIYISRSSDCQFVDMYGHMAIDKSQLDIGTRR